MLLIKHESLRAELRDLRRAFVIALLLLSGGVVLAVLTGCYPKQHTTVIERVKVERVPGAPCMDAPPEYEPFDWPYADPMDGSIRLDPAQVVELGQRLVALQTYALLQFRRCAIKDEEPEGTDGAGLRDLDQPARLACRPTTGASTSCVVGRHARPAPASWRSWWGWVP
jgi:hypothetical protein